MFAKESFLNQPSVKNPQGLSGLLGLNGRSVEMVRERELPDVSIRMRMSVAESYPTLRYNFHTYHFHYPGYAG